MSKKDVYQSQPHIHNLLKGGAILGKALQIFFVNYKKGCTRLAAASDKVYQLLVHGQWFSPGTPASSTTKTGHHDIAEILLKVALNTKNSNSNYAIRAYHH
jgi:hypothetical protein